MFTTDNDGYIFYKYAMNLFSKAGHVLTSKPDFSNHSPEQFAYFDNRSVGALSSEQRALFQVFNNVSRLFLVNGCVFFSINLLVSKKSRSQAAYDIHMMIHQITEANGTICLFRFNDEVMISFVGFGYSCILSDWYPMEDDSDRLLERLDIANMSITQEAYYFNDMIYSLARDYYLHEQPTAYELLPIDFISKTGIDRVDREEINHQIEYELVTPQRNYGDDYVEYDKSTFSKVEDINAELDLMILEMDDDNDNPFNEEIETEDDEHEENDEEEKDIYEFDDVAPEIFRDPTLIVKWLKKTSK